MGERWGEGNSAAKTPVRTVLYDDDDDLFTVKIGPGEWVTYSRDRFDSLTNRDIDGDFGDQIVGRLMEI